jgi:hypothetical protein
MNYRLKLLTQQGIKYVEVSDTDNLEEFQKLTHHAFGTFIQLESTPIEEKENGNTN